MTFVIVMGFHQIIVVMNDVKRHTYIQLVKDAFAHLGIPIADDKLEGPSTRLTYLGIEIGSDDMVIRLPEEKLLELHSLLEAWSSRCKCTKRELLSLIGKLSFAAKVVKPDRLFVRRLIDLSKTVKRLNYHIAVNSESREDILWWHRFIRSWNSVAIIQSPPVTSDEFMLFTDASGTLGFGAVYRSHWFSSPWPIHLKHHSINFKELFATVVAAQVWGYSWQNRQVLVMSDNKPVCDCWQSKSAKDPHLMRLFRYLFFHAAKFNFNIMFQHLPGHSNYYADLLSRLQVRKFQQVAPSADLLPTTIPAVVWSI